MATAAWGGTVTGVDAPKKSDEYVYNPNDFGGISQEQAKANNAKLAQSGLGLAGGSGNESVTRNQSGIGGASFGGSSTNSNGIIGGQMQAAQVATPTQWNVTATGVDAPKKADWGGTVTGVDAPKKADWGGTVTGVDAPKKADWGGTVTGVDAPKKSDEYVFNPNDFGGISQEQAKANNAKLAQSGLGLAGGSGNESVTRNQSGIGGASFGGSSTNSNGIIGGQMQAAQVATPTQWNVTAPQTVQSQIKDIINPNSPIMQQARTGALEQMNSRGLANSSMAITAGDDAAYRAAIPIATADASTYAKSASYNADAQNQVNLANAQYANQAGQSNLSANTQTSIAKMNDDTQKQLSTLDAATRTNIAKMNDDTQKQLSTLDAATRTNIAKMNDDTQKQLSTLDVATRTNIAKMNDDTQKQLSTLDVATRTNLQTLQNENQVLLNTNSQASSLFNNATAALNNIQMSTTMDEAKKQDASAQVWANLQAQIKVLSATSKLNLSSILGVDVDTNPYYIPPPSAEALRDRTNPPGPDYEWSESAQSWVKKAAPAPAPAPTNNAEWLQT